MMDPTPDLVPRESEIICKSEAGSNKLIYDPYPALDLVLDPQSL
jgi:hypothetical protein